VPVVDDGESSATLNVGVRLGCGLPSPSMTAMQSERYG